MNFFEKFIIGVIEAAPSTLPIFIHSEHGIAIANASEILLASVLSQFASKTQVPAPVSLALVSPVSVSPVPVAPASVSMRG